MASVVVAASEIDSSEAEASFLRDRLSPYNAEVAFLQSRGRARQLARPGYSGDEWGNGLNALAGPQAERPPPPPQRTFLKTPPSPQLKVRCHPNVRRVASTGRRRHLELFVLFWESVHTLTGTSAVHSNSFGALCFRS